MTHTNSDTPGADSLIGHTREAGGAPASRPAGGQGLASGHNPSGTEPGDKPGAVMGGMGTGGASTAGVSTGAMKRSDR